MRSMVPIALSRVATTRRRIAFTPILSLVDTMVGVAQYNTSSRADVSVTSYRELWHRQTRQRDLHFLWI